MGGLNDKARRMQRLGGRFARGLWSDEGSIAQKSVRGGFWVFMSSGGSRLLQVVQTAILARLLVPADFGLMQLALVAVAAAQAFGNWGIGAALVQRKDVDRRTLDTAWVMDLARNLLLFTVVQVGAHPVAIRLLKSPELAGSIEPAALAWIIRLVSVKFLCMAFRNNPGLNMLQRDLRFRRKETYEFLLGLGGAAGTVALAFWLRSVWALAWAQVYYAVGDLVGSYIVHPYRPRFRFHWREARELFGFGKHFFVAGVLGFLRGSLDKLLLGTMLGAEALGYYTLAHSLVVMPTGLMSQVFGSVMFPAFSRLQADIATLRRAFLRTLNLVAFIQSPMLAGIAATAVPLVRVLYGERYAPVAPIAVAFCAILFIGFIEGPMSSLLLARGKPYLNNLCTVAHLAVFVPLLYLLARPHGVMGVMIALGTAITTECLVRGWFALRESHVSFPKLVQAVTRPVAPALLMGVAVWMLSRALPGAGAPELLVLVAAGAAVHAGLTWALNRPGLADVRRVVAGIADG